MPALAVLGDVIEDIVVRPAGPIRHATDTEAVIVRRRGGSAANVCVVAARSGHRARLLAQAGDDRIGRSLVAELADEGVDTSAIRFGGRTGAIVVLVDASGERTMLTDRRAARSLTGAVPAWLDGVDSLHVPLYSLVDDPIATTARDTIGLAHELGIPVSIDVSSVAAIDELGGRVVLELLDDLRPAVVLANADEADALGLDGPVATAVTVVKRGRAPAVLHVPGAGSISVPAIELDDVVDTTGAGDAFAAGFLTGGAAGDPVAAAHAGHAAAAALISGRGIC